MRHLVAILLFILFGCFTHLKDLFAQPIPYGTSSESVNIYGDGGFNSRTVYYYKPTTYDSINSPILWAMHGLGGDGSTAISWSQNIADRRNALIVAPNATYMIWTSAIEVGDDTTCNRKFAMMLPVAFKQIYRHVLQKENRDTISVYLTGFSAGGQTVTRYMLIRQLVPDSIPIKMAVSASPYSYAYCLDSLDGNEIQYPSGISPMYYLYPSCHINTQFSIADTLLFAFCNEHIIQYYNENYGVLIGTADTAASPNIFGDNRYERAQFFYNYSDTNAITRGTTLLWGYAEVPDVGHVGGAMYNTKANPTDSSTIAETLLFDTPYHTVPQLAPVAAFEANTTVVYLPNASVQFINKSTTATNYLWNFGDSTISTAVNPVHQYTYADTFTVKLTAFNGTGCESIAKKWDYIIVKDATGVVEAHASGFKFQVYPNPNNGIFTVETGNMKIRGIEKLKVYNIYGELVHGERIYDWKTMMNLSYLPDGMYFIRYIRNDVVINKKIVLQE